MILGTNLIATCLLVFLQEVNAWDSDKLSVNTLFITWHGAELAFSELLEFLALPRLIWGGGDHCLILQYNKGRESVCVERMK